MKERKIVMNAIKEKKGDEFIFEKLMDENVWQVDSWRSSSTYASK